MPSSLLEGESLLALDVGAVTTRSVLFDVVEGEFRFIALGRAQSTAEAPRMDISDGARNAIANLQTVIGRTLLDGNRNLIVPSRPEGTGTDGVVVTLSAGPSVRTVIVGLLSEVSLESARRLTETVYTRVADTIGLNDHRKPAQLIDQLLRVQPELVVIGGGTDGGASRSVQKMLEPVGLANYLTPPEKRPLVLFAGNQKLEPEVRTLLGSLTPALHVSPNIRPSLDTEDLEPAARELARLFLDIRKNQIKGVDVLDGWSNGHILPTGYALGRMMRFLSEVYVSSRGILSVDIGASAAVIAAGFRGKATLGVYPQFGQGENISGLLNYTTLEQILRWCPLEVSPQALRDYLYQQSLYPRSLPATREDMAITQAISREVLHLAARMAQRDFPRSATRLRRGLLPYFEPILAGGGLLSDIARPAQSLLLLLDALQPVGVTPVILDQNDLLPLLGAAAECNPLIPVQVLDSGAFMSAGTIVAPVVSARLGTPILRARLMYANQTEARAEVKFGSLETLPLPGGQGGRLLLQPLHGADVGFGPGRPGSMPVSGGALGIIFDGRGRPLNLPTDGGHRREMIKRWQLALGGG